MNSIYRLLIFIPFFVLLESCYAPEQNCQDFQQGVFEFEALVEGELKKTRFVRKKDIEIEYYEGKADTASIRWINDCEYILKNINPENRDAKNAMHFKILTTKNNQYTFEYSLVGSDNKQKGTAYKVEE
ncbi:DNA topoisomerase IV [Psychroflexus planctonicus]|uniref:DNA topoisomerase IV n=1 Tax=Psychroflexus planctonicus TaxID=1526575 RepID=A0ABQ1SFY2_9FLAO|nr:DNA topoisomerase IV [Psychroflexus planctonicus]GGE29702.1 hypothetical protein GCM10010832_07760 [Psychroflexus planctonicus]